MKDWDVIRDDIMMLCDDNFGHVRTLPNEEERKHPGGFGMYYHFDYYGGPVSYLWINSTPLAKIWEQMTMCYEYGVRDAWIVNVGDIKNQELPLSYFLDLAYDFDSWGSVAPNTTLHYTKQWLQDLGFTEEKYEGLEQVVEEYTRWNGMCRPEVLKADTYHAVHYNEAARMIERTGRAEKIVTELRGKLAGDPLADCFYELIYYPVMASANILKMNLYAGLNQFYVKQRKKLGNRFAPKVQECIDKDKKLTEEYHYIARWKMESYAVGISRGLHRLERRRMAVSGLPHSASGQCTASSCEYFRGRKNNRRQSLAKNDIADKSGVSYCSKQMHRCGKWWRRGTFLPYSLE